jgi:hypothetical protein
MHKFRRDGYHKLRMLSLSQIKSEDIDGAVRPKPIDRECVRLSRRHVISGASLFNDKWGRVPLLIAHVRGQHVAQMAFAEYHDMIKTFPADRSDQPFGVCILPR